jgi:type I restriction enzyme S subunit
MFLVSCGALVQRFDPDMNLYVRKTLNFKFPVKFLKQFLRTNPQYGSNQAGIERNSAEEPRYVRITDIDEYGNLKDNLGVTAEIVEDKYVLNHNDLLFARSGATVGKVYLHKILNTDYTCFYAGYMIRFVVDETQLLPDYVFYYTQLDVYKEWTKAIQRAAGQPNINAEEYKSLPIPIPPLSTQTEIVNLFAQAYESKKAKEAEAQQLLASIDAYLLEKLGIADPKGFEKPLGSKPSFFVKFSQVQGKRFDPFYHKPEFEELEKSLKNGKYEVVKLGNHLQNISYGASVKNEYVNDAQNGIPLLRISDLKRNEINLSEVVYLSSEMQKELGNCFVYENDFLISRSGTTGVVAIVDKSVEGFAYGSFMIKFTLKEDAPINNTFLCYYLNCEVMQKIVERNRIGAIQGNITIPTIKNFEIPLPPLSIQTEIADHISGLRAAAKRLEAAAKAGLEQAKAEVERLILGL